LHWRWFNVLVFGMIDPDGTVLDPIHHSLDAATEVEDMKKAALTYVDNARYCEGWSHNIGLFYHVYGHNSVNSLHLHVVDLDDVGPGFYKMEHKNCPIDVVIQVLREDSELPYARSTVQHEVMQRSGSRASLRRTSFRRHPFKQQMTAACPCVNDVATFKEARACLWRMGGPDYLRTVLEEEGYLDPGNPMLKTGTAPLNVFARLAFEDTQSRKLLDIMKGVQKNMLSASLRQLSHTKNSQGSKDSQASAS